MPLFNREKIKQQEKIEAGLKDYFKLLNCYEPSFRTYDGGVYEMELTRAAIHCFANHCSKLVPVVNGSGNEQIQRTLQYKPNPLMDTKKYLYRIATITQTKNNCYIVPLWDDYHQRIIGFYPMHPDKCQLKKVNGETWLLYELQNGQKKAMKFAEVGRINQFQNKSEMFGEGNAAMNATLQLMNSQNQAIEEGVKNSAKIKLLAILGQSLKPKDVQAERENFAELTFRNNDSGTLMIDAKYKDVKQLSMNQFVLDDKQMKLIRDNVYEYFGVSTSMLTNSYKSDEWNAFYEGKIEPFALELGLVHTDMLFSSHEVAFGNEVKFSANRMNYLATGEKVSVSQTLFDRGLLTRNEAREIMNLPSLGADGDTFYIRKEYTDVYNTLNSQEGEENNDSNEETEQ